LLVAAGCGCTVAVDFAFVIARVIFGKDTTGESMKILVVPSTRAPVVQCRRNRAK
jgi:hypothetical protein